MSGEQDLRPDLALILADLRKRVYELERRVSGDDQGLDLSDINDVRVDSLGDGTVALVDGSALTYRAADKLWVPGSGGSGFPIGPEDDGTRTISIVGAPLGLGWLALHDATSAAASVYSTVDADEAHSGVAAQTAAIASSSVEALAQNGDASVQVLALGDAGANLAKIDVYSPSGGPTEVTVQGDRMSLDVGSGAGEGLFIGNLPTSDPGVSGQLYTLAGIVHVSP